VKSTRVYEWVHFIWPKNRLLDMRQKGRFSGPSSDSNVLKLNLPERRFWEISRVDVGFSNLRSGRLDTPFSRTLRMKNQLFVVNCQGSQLLLKLPGQLASLWSSIRYAETTVFQRDIVDRVGSTFERPGYGFARW
jgi:hypothetical protein